MPTMSASVSSLAAEHQRQQLAAHVGDQRGRCCPGRTAPRRSRWRRASPPILPMRSRACSRSACAISWPMIIATSSSVSCSFWQDAVVEGDLAAGHAEGVDLLAADQVDLPLPLLRARVPLRGERNDALRDVAQPLQLRVVGGRQRALAARLLQHLPVLLRGGGLDLLGRHQLAELRRSCRTSTPSRCAPTTARHSAQQAAQRTACSSQARRSQRSGRSWSCRRFRCRPRAPARCRRSHHNITSAGSAARC